MNAAPVESLETLADHLRGELPTARIDVTTFPSGAASLGIARDGRLFVMEYAPAIGFGVDEVSANEGFLHKYAYLTTDFNEAAERLTELAGVRQQAQLNLIVLYVADLSRSKEFYETIGLTFVPEQHNQGPAHFSSQFGSAVLELYPAKNSDSITRSMRLGFQVRSVDEALLRLSKLGAETLTLPKDSAWGRRAVVRDLDGNSIEITSPLSQEKVA